jgi:hypothetical protein
LLSFVSQSSGEPEDSDPYSINVVKAALKARLGATKVIHSWSQKQLFRLGDCVAIAILKIASEEQLKNPRYVQDILPVVRDSFDQPQLIENQADKAPKVTLFLLESLHQTISDPQVRQDIQETIAVVKARTGGPS